MSDESKKKDTDTSSAPDVEPPNDAKQRKKRTQRNFPASTFEEPLEFAKSILDFGSGQPVRRLSLFDHLKKSPDSGPSRQLITNANKYGLIRGNYGSDLLELTKEGLTAVGEHGSSRELARARFKLAVEDIPPFKALFDQFSGNKLPAKAALIDAIKAYEVEDAAAEEAVDTFIVNLRFLGLLQTLSGAERILKLDHYLDTLPASEHSVASISRFDEPQTKSIITAEVAEFETTAFFIAPIGPENSEPRKHSDLFLGAIVEPALEQFKLRVVRADSIEQPGIISRQIIEYLVRSRLVIADLSFHNPNVFYELAIRHMMRRPVVQIMRALDKVPFDVNQIRTVLIDTTDIYTLVPRIDTYRSEIANQVRRALDDPDAVDNPISRYFPTLHVTERE